MTRELWTSMWTLEQVRRRVMRTLKVPTGVEGLEVGEEYELVAVSEGGYRDPARVRLTGVYRGADGTSTVDVEVVRT